MKKKLNLFVIKQIKVAPEQNEYKLYERSYSLEEFLSKEKCSSYYTGYHFNTVYVKRHIKKKNRNIVHHDGHFYEKYVHSDSEKEYDFLKPEKPATIIYIYRDVTKKVLDNRYECFDAGLMEVLDSFKGKVVKYNNFKNFVTRNVGPFFFETDYDYDHIYGCYPKINLRVPFLEENFIEIYIDTHLGVVLLKKYIRNINKKLLELWFSPNGLGGINSKRELANLFE